MKDETIHERTLDVINPANGDVVASVVCQGQADIDDAVTKAVKAQSVWAGLAPEERGKFLWKWGELIEAASDEIAKMDVLCMGKVIRDALVETRRAARHARYWAGMADKIYGQQLADVPGRLSYSVREPLGVYAVVLPWNAPAHSFLARTSPALACGNAVIVKPSELSPLSAQRLAELAVEAGMPEHVLQVVTGDGQTGNLLCAHSGVAGISFTGSPPTGRKVLAAAVDHFKKVTLELGGKSPIVIFDDADFDSAVRAALVGVLTNAGQICAASTRLMVHSSIAERFVAAMKERLANIRIGDPMDMTSQVGPVVCKRQYDRVVDLIGTGTTEGATLAHGGSGADASKPSVGFYVSPTIFTGVTPQHTVYREEIFGPVLSVVEFTSEEEAVSLCNDSEFGLAAYVWTSDASRMLRMMTAIQAGVVHGNTTLVMDSGLPFGGWKDSGLGGAFGADAVDGCTRTKRVTLRMQAGPLPEVWEGV